MSQGAELLSIVKRNRDAESLHPARVEDFDLAPAGPAHAADVVGNPNASLYVLDTARERALFVENAPGADLLARPFYYQAQANAATRLIGVPYPQLIEWGAQCAPADGIAMFYSVGRCGSTLLSRLLQSVPLLVSLSEPDTLSQIDSLLWNGELSAEMGHKLVRATLQFYWNPDLKPGARRLVIKTRFPIPSIAPVIKDEFPTSRACFMYRNAEAVVHSSMRLRSRSQEAIDRLRKRLQVIAAVQKRGSMVDDVEREHGHLGLEVLQWAWAADQYLDLRAGGLQIAALRYEELVATTDRIMTQLLEPWGVAWDPAITPRVMAEDSQEGTIFARGGDKAPMSDRDREAVRKLLPQVSRVSAPDEILAGTLV